jgi:hypothetical protein
VNVRERRRGTKRTGNRRTRGSTKIRIRTKTANRNRRSRRTE